MPSLDLLSKCDEPEPDLTDEQRRRISRALAEAVVAELEALKARVARLEAERRDGADPPATG